MSAASLLCCLTGSGPSARRPDTRGAAADASLQATRHVPCRDIIVHPKFVKTLALPPLEFCPMDWLPDEVVTNVLVHMVRGLATTTRASSTRRDGAGARRLSHQTSKNLFSRFLALTTRVRIFQHHRRASTPRVSPRRAGARAGSWQTTRCGASCSAAGSGSRSRRTARRLRTRAGGVACTGTTRRRWTESCGAKRRMRRRDSAAAATRFGARGASGRCTCSTAARYSSAREHSKRNETE